MNIVEKHIQKLKQHRDELRSDIISNPTHHGAAILTSIYNDCVRYITIWESAQDEKINQPLSDGTDRYHK